MTNDYPEVRRQFKSIDTRADLRSIWTSERFEGDAQSIEDALRVYEMAIRVDGWDAVKEWARPLLASNKILNPQLVELAIHSIELKDSDFLAEITDQLLKESPADYFLFWHTLFAIRHSSPGEKHFRAQLGNLSDDMVVKYRRRLRAVLRKLRFRCYSDREKAIGSIVFGMYDDYEAGPYDSEVFTAFVECHAAASARRKTTLAHDVARAQHMEEFIKAATKLGIWVVAEGIRTSHRLPRTLNYLAAMGPKMTDEELVRNLRAFDRHLLRADHKKPPKEVVKLGQDLTSRLRELDLTLDEWGKLFPMIQSPILLRLLEGVIDEKVEALTVSGDLNLNPYFVVSHGLAGRYFRPAMLASYLFYRSLPSAAIVNMELYTTPSILTHPSPLFPQGPGRGVTQSIWTEMPEKDRDRALYDLIQKHFPSMNRRQNLEDQMSYLVNTFRYMMHRSVRLNGGLTEKDIPVIFLSTEPEKQNRDILIAHLKMLPAAVVILFETKWEDSLELDHVVELSVTVDLKEVLDDLQKALGNISARTASFETRRDEVNSALRHLLLEGVPYMRHVVHSRSDTRDLRRY